MANYEVLEPGGHAALIDGLKDYTDREGGVGAEQIADGSVNLDKLGDDVLDELDSKAYADGYYAQLTAGAADNLTGRGDATTAEFLYRTAGGTADIETGQAVAKSVKGNTLVWNQLITSGNKWYVSPVFGELSYNDGVASVEVTSSNRSAAITWTYYSRLIVPNHKYVVTFDTLATSQASSTKMSSMYSSVATVQEVNVATNVWTHCSLMYTMKSDASPTTFYIYYDGGQTLSVGDIVQFKNVNVFDLTVMFGSGNEPSTAAEFEALFPLPYYEYDAGSLLSVNMEGIETVGFNLWDEEWELGTFNTTTGADNASTTQIRAKNLIPVFPNTEYYCNTSVGEMWIMLFDANKAPIAPPSGMPSVSGNSFNRKNNAFTTTADARYMRFYMTNTYGTTYNHDICINLSWSGRRNGEYEAFWKSQRLIDVDTYFPDGMRSAGTVRDELTSTEAITRVGVVDLGTLEWLWYNSGNAFMAALPGRLFSDSNTVICAPYGEAIVAISSDAILNAPDKSIVCTSFNVNIFVKDSTYGTDPAAFKTAMSGVMLYLPLATPTVTPIDPPLNLSYRVDDFGTELVMVTEDERSAPPVLDIAYGLNVVDFVRRAPSEYISHASMSQFRLALMSHLGVFINETWDEVDNRYEYTITSE